MFWCTMGLFSISIYFLESSRVWGRTSGCGVHLCRTSQFNHPPPLSLAQRTPNPPLSATRNAVPPPPLCTGTDRLCNHCPVRCLQHLRHATALLSGLEMLPRHNSRLFLLHPKFLSMPCGIRSSAVGLGFPGGRGTPPMGGQKEEESTLPHPLVGFSLTFVFF